MLWVFFLLSLVFGPASPTPAPDVVVLDVEQKDITDINKGLNHLREGDIMVLNQRSSVLGSQFRWDFPVPYTLSRDYSIQEKLIILRAFDQFRLKSCIDFKTRTAEEYYISVEKREGCWSFVGRTVRNGQIVSIGNGCVATSIIEHELLHALGFHHEQSRYDRDDYVTIVTENIIKGFEGNFNKVPASISSTQDTPYDYESVMHYGKNAFSNGNGSTIVTKLPEFQDVIGQSGEMSEYDVIELNKLYKCNSSVSFRDHCSFDDESLCEMSVCSASKQGWQRVNSVSGVNVIDHTYLGKEPNVSAGKDFFMHFSTEAGKEGDSAILESRKMTPKRDCNVQCLQFYYHHSGSEFDQLNIWIREYQGEGDTRGTLRLMDQITGAPANYWQLHHVPLNANKTFQVEFEARKGAGNSSGGFSLDDINISETECPNSWQIRDFQKLLNISEPGTILNSPLFYSSEGYRFQFYLSLYVNFFYINFRLVSGAFDDQLQWPCLWKQVTSQVLDQNPHMQKRMSYELGFTIEEKMYGDKYFWDKPSTFEALEVIGSETVYVGPAIGYFMSTDFLSKKEYIKGGDIIFMLSMQDISGLFQNDSLPCTEVKVKNTVNVFPDESAIEGPCATRALPETPTSPPVTTEDNGGCMDIFCSSGVKTLPSSLIFFVIILLWLMN